MNQIIENLKAFNRKERFFLVGAALGNPEYILCQQFIYDIERAFNVTIPSNYFAAMDYHLDWVYASLALAANNHNGPFPNAKQIIHASIEDIDFLIACEIQNDCHYIFLEAKGVTLFSNKQLQSKMARLTEIFGKENEKWKNVVPHFGIVSPKEPRKIQDKAWPVWAKPDGQVKWIKLEHIPTGLKKVVRCNRIGKADNAGDYWMVKPGEF